MSFFTERIQQAFAHSRLDNLETPKVINEETLPSWFDVSELASASMGMAASALARFHRRNGFQMDGWNFDQRLANLWFGMSIQPIDFELPSAWDDIAGIYETSDGWIRLHTNAPHHKQCALSVLNSVATKEAVAHAVRDWRAEALEDAIVSAGGCAAKLRSFDEWATHPQGKKVGQEPLIHWHQKDATSRLKEIGTSTAPLSGLKVLDLTRVLAGPVASRFLAAYGADVLRIDSPDWDEPGLIPEVTLGKRCAGLDLKTEEGRQRLTNLLKEADVLLHGYRADALARLGFSQEDLNRINPNLINASLNSYGWKGPWRNRRGFDSLVQMSSGIAHFAMQQSQAEQPVPLPVQALDHATGYLLAAAVTQAVELRQFHGVVSTAKTSLAATANLLAQSKRVVLSDAMDPLNNGDLNTFIETTDWGKAKRVRFPVLCDQVKPSWGNGAVKLRSSEAQW